MTGPAAIAMFRPLPIDLVARGRFASVLGTTLLLACAAAAAPRDDLAQAATAFDESVLRNNDDSSQPSSVRKWTRPLRIAVRNPGASPGLVPSSIKAVRTIAEKAGLEAAETERTDGANFVIYFDENGQLGKNNCQAFPRWEKWALVHAEIRINPGYRGSLDNCFIHEAMHAFGFLSHPHAADSVLSYVYQRRELTPLDVNLIRVLYDPAMKVGTPPQAASAQACDLLARVMGAGVGDRQAVCDGRTPALRTPAGEGFEARRLALPRTAGAEGACSKQANYPVRIYPDRISFGYTDGWHSFPVDAAGMFAGSFTNEKNNNLYRLSGNLKRSSVKVENATAGCVWEGSLAS
jgi:hypothetical protein